MRGGKLTFVRLLLALIAGIGIGGIAHNFYVNTQEHSVYSSQRMVDVKNMQRFYEQEAPSAPPPATYPEGSLELIGNLAPFLSDLPSSFIPPTAYFLENPINTESLDQALNDFLTSPAANAINFSASVIAIIGMLDSAYKKWSKKHSEGSTGVQKPSPQQSESESEIVAIRLLMTDGTQHRIKAWLKNPDQLKQHIDTFNQPSSPVKPVEAIFVLVKDGPMVVKVSEGTQNNPQLDLALSYLQIDPSQK